MNTVQLTESNSKLWVIKFYCNCPWNCKDALKRNCHPKSIKKIKNYFSVGRHDTRANDIQHNDTRNNDKNSAKKTLHAECFYSESNIVTLNVVKLSVAWFNFGGSGGAQWAEME